MEYIEERDGPPNITPILGLSTLIPMRARLKHWKSVTSRTQMTPGEVRDFFGGMDPNFDWVHTPARSQTSRDELTAAGLLASAI